MSNSKEIGALGAVASEMRKSLPDGKHNFLEKIVAVACRVRIRSRQADQRWTIGGQQAVKLFLENASRIPAAVALCASPMTRSAAINDVIAFEHPSGSDERQRRQTAGCDR